MSVRKLIALLNGGEDIGSSLSFWVMIGIVLAGFALMPLWVSEFGAYNIAFYLLNFPLALGLCVLWGYCGILSFGQIAYFGIAGYIYGIIAGNMMGSPWGPAVGSVGGLVVCAVTAAIFGYFVFYARVHDWIVPILTLVFTLLLETFLGQTAGYQWRVGNVQLGGYNGMTAIPSFQIGDLVFMGYSFYFYALIVVIACYFGCRLLVNSHWGKLMLAIREDPVRTELLGYDIRAVQLGVFVVAGVLAGISGLLYVQWGNYITPSQVGLLQAALPVVWVAVGGRERLLAVIVGTFALNWLSYSLSTAGSQNAPVIMGFLLVGVMVFFPRGIIVTIVAYLDRVRGQRRAERGGRA
jgi:ABC-type branched-subunit amino acid transport system permease subunit